MTLLPGLLQLPAYTEARVRSDKADWSTRFDPTRALEARAARQRVLDRQNGPTYEVILDELVIRRPTAPPSAFAAQPRHLVESGRTRRKITIRVLPLAAALPGHTVPKSAFSIYRYPDPVDPTVVAVDTVTSDVVLTEPGDARHYLDLYENLRGVCLAPQASLDLLAKVAREMTHETGAP